MVLDQWTFADFVVLLIFVPFPRRKRSSLSTPEKSTKKTKKQGDQSATRAVAKPSLPQKGGRKVLPPRLPAGGLGEMFRNNYVVSIAGAAHGLEGIAAASVDNTIVILDDEEEKNEAPPPDKTMVEVVGEELMGLATGGLA